MISKHAIGDDLTPTLLIVSVWVAFKLVRGVRSADLPGVCGLILFWVVLGLCVVGR